MQTIVQKKHISFQEWMSGKTVRVAMVLGALLLMSIATNALIILADRGMLGPW